MESAISPQSGETPSLVEEIIFEEILPKLPVKSLLKFRCVAKSWCSLIGSKRFIKAHLNNSIKSSNFDNHRILFESSGLKTCSLPLTDLIPYNANIPSFIGALLCFVGSCDGIICFLVDRKRFILWNPTTKKIYNLPDFDNEMKSVSIGACRFGFDESNHDYKVFSTIWKNNVTIGKVYSLRNNSWQVIEEMGVTPRYGESVCARGKLHWCSISFDYIVTFDLSSHVYGVVELPSYPTSYPKWKFKPRLGVIGGCLSVHFIYPNFDLDLWIMKEYGVKESWDKVVFVPYNKDFRGCGIPKPVAISTNGEVLLMTQTSFAIYNPKCGVYRYPHVAGCPEFCPWGIYIESLVSVAPDGEQESRVPEARAKDQNDTLE